MAYVMTGDKVRNDWYDRGYHLEKEGKGYHSRELAVCLDPWSMPWEVLAKFLDGYYTLSGES